jgi:CBS domain-containing protein
MFVETILPAARDRLATLEEGAPLVEAAKRLRGPGARLVVVCAADGRMRGVVSKTDVVDRISQCSGASCTTSVSSVMTREVISCRPDAPLRDVWSAMTSRGLEHVPVVDADGRPQGVLAARQVMEALLGEAEQEEELLRAYVMCVGYR